MYSAVFILRSDQIDQTSFCQRGLILLIWQFVYIYGENVRGWCRPPRAFLSWKISFEGWNDVTRGGWLNPAERKFRRGGEFSSVVKTKAGRKNVGAAVSWQNEVKGIRLRQCRIDSSRADIAAVKSRDVDNLHGGLFYSKHSSLFLSLSVFQGERPYEQIEACPSIGWTWPSSGLSCRSSSPHVSVLC